MVKAPALGAGDCEFEPRHPDHSMHKFHLCILSCAKNDKYKKRLYDFFHYYGYKNIHHKHLIKISFLVEGGGKARFFAGRYRLV